MSGPSNPIKTLPTRRLLSLLTRFALTALALLWLTKVFSVDLVEQLLPAFRWEVSTLDDNLDIASLDLGRDGPSTIVRLRANLIRPIEIGGHTAYPVGWGSPFKGGTEVRLNARGVLQASVIFLIVILSWPHRGIRELGIRALLAIPLIGLLIVIDAPLELLGNFQQAVARHANADVVRPLFMWDKLLEGGGNSMLALAFAAVAIVVAQSICGRRGPQVVK